MTADVLATTVAGTLSGTSRNADIDAMMCKEQKVALSLSYTVAMVSHGVFALPIGLFFDRYGLRMTRTITM